MKNLFLKLNFLRLHIQMNDEKRDKATKICNTNWCLVIHDQLRHIQCFFLCFLLFSVLGDATTKRFIFSHFSMFTLLFYFSTNLVNVSSFVCFVLQSIIIKNVFFFMPNSLFKHKNIKVFWNTRLGQSTWKIGRKWTNCVSNPLIFWQRLFRWVSLIKWDSFHLISQWTRTTTYTHLRYNYY